jgi:hypothetical protein
MTTNNITFESGKEYTLAQLFSGDNKIVIPDLQRDYCWGDKAWDKDKRHYTELVSGFVQNLFESFTDFKEKKNTDNITLGLIYGYESPKHYIQLCDGQQRITTLFLLLGMLNRKTGNNSFQQFLISDYELKNDQEPYLQYAIRESTLYFLSALVCKFFKENNNLSADKIEEQDWYFEEYNLDASIQSMIAALETIEKALADVDINCLDFGNFVLQNLQMFYYDMGDRTRGEETFVVINTTGEPLTATENLKPILLGDLDNKEKKYPNIDGKPNQETELDFYSNQWEDREEWFWQNETTTPKTADGGMNDFFVWYWQIRLLQESSWKNKKKEKLNPRELFVKKPNIDETDDDKPLVDSWNESCKPETLHQYFLALKKLLELSKCSNIGVVLNTINPDAIDLNWFRKSDLHVVLPLIAYLVEFSNPKYFYEFVRRIRKNYFDKKRERSDFVDWRHIVQIIDFSKTENEVLTFETKGKNIAFKPISNVNLNEWYNEDEKNKDILKVKQKIIVEEWENHPDLMGDLSPLWNANSGRENNYENLLQIWEMFSNLYNCYDENWSKNDAILSNYVRLFRVLIEQEYRIGHINRTSGMVGAWFSKKNPNKKENDYFKYLENNYFLSLLKATDIISELKANVKTLLPKKDILLSDETFTAEKHLKAWFLIKTLNAARHNNLLSFYEENGEASYENCDDNKLNANLIFSLGNSICGYAVKSGFGSGNYIRYTGSENWDNECILDKIIGITISFDEFKNRQETPIPLAKIVKINEEIEILINEFYQ